MPVGAGFLSGKVGGVLVGGTAWALGKWKIPIDTKMIPVNPFTAAGFQQLVAGFTKATITLDGYYDSGNMPMTSGNSYQFTLQWTNALSIVVTARVSNITPSNDAEGSPQITITADSDGVFTAATT
jgi:hypothetical protein